MTVFEPQLNNRYNLLFEMGLCPLEAMRCETWILDDEESVELFASFDIPTNILVKFDKIPD
ncbi:unnamed protein product [marine sediment metagenome]|uniref:Uncharacterized protein n=1 Tax=marine sediment metagenome TaxID=412755 RepID=X1LC37_9ZZZZ